MACCEVVIVNFNAGGFLTEAVRAALKSGAVTRIHVIDNASTDKSLDLLPVESGNRLTVVRNPTNLGFAAACNMGLAQADCDFSLLLNPDCRPLDGAIDRLMDALASTPEAGMAGPLLLNPDGSEQAGGRRAVPTPWRGCAGSFPTRLPISSYTGSRCRTGRALSTRSPALA